MLQAAVLESEPRRSPLQSNAQFVKILTVESRADYPRQADSSFEHAGEERWILSVTYSCLPTMTLLYATSSECSSNERAIVSFALQTDERR
jgi:hypothetical protein